MTRELNWNLSGGDSLCEQLMTPERIREIESFLANSGWPELTLQDTINLLNERADLSDSEWTAIICTLGAHFFSKPVQ